MTVAFSNVRMPAFFGPQSKIETEPIYRLPVRNGTWSALPGNSNWNSTLKSVTDITKGKGIPFVNGRPNFSEWAKATFEVEGLTGTKADFPLIYKKMMSDFGFKTQTAVQDWLKQNDLTPHHDKGNSIQIVPSVINNIPHSGGAADLRNQ